MDWNQILAQRPHRDGGILEKKNHEMPDVLFSFLALVRHLILTLLLDLVLEPRLKLIVTLDRRDSLNR